MTTTITSASDAITILVAENRHPIIVEMAKTNIERARRMYAERVLNDAKDACSDPLRTDLRAIAARLLTNYPGPAVLTWVNQEIARTL